MQNRSKETPLDLARRLYENMPQAPQPMEINGERHWPGVEHLPQWAFCERLAERLHEAENRDGYGLPVHMTMGDWRKGSDALADVLCWIAGFKAHGGSAEPVNLDQLRALKRQIDRCIEADQPFIPTGTGF